MNGTRITALLACALALLGTFPLVGGCASGTTANGTVEVDFGPLGELTIEFEAGPDGKTYDAQGGSPAANRCIVVKWFDEDGQEVGSEVIQLDEAGGARGLVPEDTTQFRLDVADCPDPDEEEQAVTTRPGERHLSFGGHRPEAPILTPPDRIRTPMKGPLPMRAPNGALGLQDVILVGGPVLPALGEGEVESSFAFVVRALDRQHARHIIAPLVAGGPGTPLPINVRHASWSEVERDRAGVRVQLATGGRYDSFVFEFNDGAFFADLENGHDVIRYPLGSWDVVEMLIPGAAVDEGVLPGATYVNAGEATYTLEGQPHAMGFGLHVSNTL
jgi:hypothetical protein